MPNHIFYNQFLTAILGHNIIWATNTTENGKMLAEIVSFLKHTKQKFQFWLIAKESSVVLSVSNALESFNQTYHHRIFHLKRPSPYLTAIFEPDSTNDNDSRSVKQTLVVSRTCELMLLKRGDLYLNLSTSY